MILEVVAHHNNMVERKCQQNPFHPASSKMFVLMTLESLKKTIDLLIGHLKLPVILIHLKRIKKIINCELSASNFL